MRAREIEGEGVRRYRELLVFRGPDWAGSGACIKQAVAGEGGQKRRFRRGAILR